MTGAFFRPGEWYERLKKPSWRPPNRLFAPVWTILYLMIAVSGLEPLLDGGILRMTSSRQTHILEAEVCPDRCRTETEIATFGLWESLDEERRERMTANHWRRGRDPVTRLLPRVSHRRDR